MWKTRYYPGKPPEAKHQRQAPAPHGPDDEKPRKTLEASQDSENLGDGPSDEGNREVPWGKSHSLDPELCPRTRAPTKLLTAGTRPGPLEKVQAGVGGGEGRILEKKTCLSGQGSEEVHGEQLPQGFNHGGRSCSDAGS